MKEPQIDKRDVARELARKYSTMTHDELDILEGILVPMKFAKGEMILKEGEVCKYIYYIELMCIESLFKEEPTHLQVQAIEPTLVFGLPKIKLEEVALHNVNIQILYRKILEESLIISQIHADLLRFESAQNRYKRMCKMSPQVVLRAPLVYIASYLQMTPETLSRVRSSTLLDD